MVAFAKYFEEIAMLPRVEMPGKLARVQRLDVKQERFAAFLR